MFYECFITYTLPILCVISNTNLFALFLLLLLLGLLHQVHLFLCRDEERIGIDSGELTRVGGGFTRQISGHSCADKFLFLALQEIVKYNSNH